MMQLAERARVPFWPAASVHDIPCLVLDWMRLAAEAEDTAAAEIARRNRPHPAH